MGKCVCFIRATWGVLQGQLRQCFIHDMLQELVPSLEHQHSASTAWLLVLAQTGRDQFYQTILYI